MIELTFSQFKHVTAREPPHIIISRTKRGLEAGPRIETPLTWIAADGWQLVSASGKGSEESVPPTPPPSSPSRPLSWADRVVRGK